MSVQIQLRRDTAAAWSIANTVLASGEIGIETNTKKFKIGDGTIAWNDNIYAGGGGPWGGMTGTLADQTDLKAALDAKVAKSELVFNVKDYGAMGNGSTDDTTAINATITACRAANGGTVFMPHGVYKITDRIVLKNNIHLKGDGNSGPDLKGTIIVQYTATKDGLYCVTDGSDPANIRITDMRIQTSGTNTGGRGVFFNASGAGIFLDVMIDNVFVQNFGVAGFELGGVITSSVKN